MRNTARQTEITFYLFAAAPIRKRGDIYRNYSAASVVSSASATWVSASASIVSSLTSA